jgi:endonuclease/exonuclease/phosphatase (EEP) superfamily protein YafD
MDADKLSKLSWPLRSPTHSLRNNTGELRPMNDADSDKASSNPPIVRRRAKAVRIASLLDLALIAVATALLWAVSERTWWGSIFTFLPRHVFLVGPALLLVASVFADRRSILINLAGFVMVIGPLMGGHFPVTSLMADKKPENALTIVSCNMEYFQPGVDAAFREIVGRAPDVVAMQEAVGGYEFFPKYFPGWHIVHEDQFWIGSRYPLQRVDMCNTGDFPHPSAVSVRVDAPAGSFILHDVHLTTPRYGFVQINAHSVLNGGGPRNLEAYNVRRASEATKVRAYVDAIDAKVGDGRLPVLVAGDFNTPSVSNLYRACWLDFQNAFETAGFGFGYTAPCTRHRYWFNDVPWVRIDHILADEHWAVTGCEIGPSRGSDHRLICAQISPRRADGR